MEMNPVVYKNENMKKQSIQRMSIFIIEYYANVKQTGVFFVFFLELSGQC